MPISDPQVGQRVRGKTCSVMCPAVSGCRSEGFDWAGKIIAVYDDGPDFEGEPGWPLVCEVEITHSPEASRLVGCRDEILATRLEYMD